MKKPHLSTTAVQGAFDPEQHAGAMAVPVYLTSAYHFPTADDAAEIFNLSKPGYIYTRLNNPTTDVLERRLAEMDGGVAACTFASGTAALFSTLLCLMRAGDHIVSSSSIYGGRHTMLAIRLPRIGMESTIVETEDPADFEKAIRPNTKAIFLEALPNPQLNLLDIEAIAEIAHRHGIPLIVDNTVATPALLRPIDHGADIVTYSLTDHQELELKASDLDKDELCDMLLASAYLPAFRLEKLGGKYYADGGVQDVVPIHALVENGCKDIIALRIFGFGIEKRFRIPDDVHVTTIGPTVDLGNILNFDAEQSRQNMRLGYFDAQRVLYGLYGSTYYIDRTMSEDAARQQLLEYLGTDDGSLRTFHEKTLPQIAKALKCDGDYYDLLIAVLEHDAKELGIESERIMTDMELLQAILAQPEPPEAILPAQEPDAPAETEPEASNDTQSAAPKAAEEVAAKAAELSQDIEKHINRLLGKMRPRRNHPGTAESAEPETAADETEK